MILTHHYHNLELLSNLLKYYHIHLQYTNNRSLKISKTPTTFSSDAPQPIKLKIKTQLDPEIYPPNQSTKPTIINSINFNIQTNQTNELTVFPRATALRNVEGRFDDVEFSSISSSASNAVACLIASES